MITVQTISGLCEEHFRESPYFLVEVVIKPVNRISVFIDGDQRVNVDVCRNLNHFLVEQLNRDQEDFDLTVSSPGIDKPLQMIRQFHKNIGKELEIVLKSGVKMNASLLSIENQMLTFLEIRKLKKNQPETTPITMNFEEIKSAKEVINFKS